jgi:hypothetical protein
MPQPPISKRMSNNIDKNENLLLEKIIRDIEVLTEDVQNLITNNTTHIAVINNELKALGIKVKTLLDIVKDGTESGELGLTSKILLIQNAIDDLKTSAIHIKQESDKVKADELALKKSEESAARLSETNMRISQNVESTRGRWALFVAIVAVAGTIAQAILGHIFK